MIIILSISYAQDVVVYRATGDGDAPSFFHVDATTGAISIKKQLYPGTTTDYTVRAHKIKSCQNAV